MGLTAEKGSIAAATQLRIAIFDASGRQVFQANQPIDAAETTNRVKGTISNPRLWSPEHHTFTPWRRVLQMNVGQTFQWPLIVHFYDANSNEYRIYMGPNWERETNYVQVTCNSIASDGCNDWFIDAGAVNGVAGQAIGRLVNFTKRSSVNEGDYYFGLHFHLTRP